jgi:hypothetical protein
VFPFPNANEIAEAMIVGETPQTFGPLTIGSESIYPQLFGL